MDSKNRKRLEDKGWKVGNAQSFLGLSDEEMAIIDLKIKIGEEVKQLRKQQRMTQTKLASLMKSNQSRIAKIEKGDPSVSFDLQFKSLFKLGATEREIASVLYGKKSSSSRIDSGRVGVRRVGVPREGVSGKNKYFKIPASYRKITMDQFVTEIKQGKHPDYHVRKINGVVTPVSNPRVRGR